MNDVGKAIDEDYSAIPDLAARIMDALEQAGIPPESWTPEILAPADQIHGGGLTQTRLHAELTTIRPDMHLIDIGCGVGGPARHLAGGGPRPLLSGRPWEPQGRHGARPGVEREVLGPKSDLLQLRP